MFIVASKEVQQTGYLAEINSCPILLHEKINYTIVFIMSIKII